MSDWWGYEGDGCCPIPPYPIGVPLQGPNLQNIDASLALVTPSDTGVSTPLTQAIGGRLLRAGDTMSGRLLLGLGNPVSSLEAACKQYVDALALGLQPANPLDLAVPLTINQTYTGAGEPSFSLFLNQVDQTQGGAGDGLSFGAWLQTITYGTPAACWFNVYSNLIEAGGSNKTNGNANTPGAGYFRAEKSSAPVGRTSVAVAVGAGGSYAVQVADVTNFSWSYPGSASTGVPVSSANPLPVKVGSTIYQLIGVSSTSGHVYPTGYTGAVSETGVPACSQLNTDSVVVGGYFAGGLAGTGTLTFSTKVSAADGAAGSLVVAQVQGDPLEIVCFEMRDNTGLSSNLAGPLAPIEVDMGFSGYDDLGSATPGAYATTDAGSRRMINLYPGLASGSTYTQAELDAAFFINPASNGVLFKRGMRWANCTFEFAAFDLRESQLTAGANAIWLANAMPIAFDTAGNHQLRYNQINGNLEYLLAGTAGFSVTSAGGVVANSLTLTQPAVLASYAVAGLPAVVLGGFVLANNGRNTGESAGNGTGCLVFGKTVGTTPTWCAVWSGVAVTA